jgi:hypothetical protein
MENGATLKTEIGPYTQWANNKFSVKLKIPSPIPVWDIRFQEYANMISKILKTIEDFEGTYYCNCSIEIDIIFDAKEQLDLFIMSLKLENWVKYVEE